MKWSLIVLLSLCSMSAQAHRGGKDANGGHVNNADGPYHCHPAGSCALPKDAAAEGSLDWPDDESDVDLITTVAGSWSTAKKWAKHVIYKGQDRTFYCGCTYRADINVGGVDVASCDYNKNGASKYRARATVLEQEHILPASLMPARQFACWNEGVANKCANGSRGCCERNDLKARAMLFDLHNLVPSVGQVNALRSDSRYGIIDGEDLKLACDFEWAGDIAEPPADKRGEVARIWLYMHQQHGVVLEGGELEMYMSWSLEDPPEAWEFERDERIKRKQGNGNPFVRMFSY